MPPISRCVLTVWYVYECDTLTHEARLVFGLGLELGVARTLCDNAVTGCDNLVLGVNIRTRLVLQ